MKKKYKRIIKGILFVCLSFFICLDVKAADSCPEYRNHYQVNDNREGIVQVTLNVDDNSKWAAIFQISGTYQNDVILNKDNNTTTFTYDKLLYAGQDATILLVYIEGKDNCYTKGNDIVNRIKNNQKYDDLITDKDSYSISSSDFDITRNGEKDLIKNNYYQGAICRDFEQGNYSRFKDDIAEDVFNNSYAKVRDSQKYRQYIDACYSEYLSSQPTDRDVIIQITNALKLYYFNNVTKNTKKIETPKDAKLVKKPTEKIGLTCDFLKLKGEDGYYANQNIFYYKDEGKVIKKGDYSCTKTCQEVVTVDYGPPVASIAGLCFEYKVRVKSTVTCETDDGNLEPPNKNNYNVCEPVAYCTSSSNLSHDISAGPNEEFDSCINSCDNGKYTQKCINKCYNKVYSNSSNQLLSYADKVEATKLANSNCDNKLIKTATMGYGSQLSQEILSHSGEGGCYGYYTRDKEDNDTIIWVPGSTYWSKYARYYFLTASVANDTINHDESNFQKTNAGRKKHNGTEIWYYKASTSSNTTLQKPGFKIASKWTDSDGNIIGQGKVTCNWNCSFTGCSDAKYLNQKEASEAWKTASNDYEEVIRLCSAQASCSSTIAEFTISINNKTKEPTVEDKKTFTSSLKNDNNKVTLTYGEKSNNMILSRSDCYGETVASTNAYMTEWSFPGTWINNKTGEISYVDKTNDKAWHNKKEKYCTSLNSANVNVGWWYYGAMKAMGKSDAESKKNVLTGESMTDEELKAAVEDKNITASTRNFGYFNWNIDISCFYALYDPTECTGTICETCTDPDCNPCTGPLCNPDPDTTCTGSDCNPAQSYRIRTVDNGDLFPSTEGKDTTDPSKTGRTPGFNWTFNARNNKNPNYKINPDKLLTKIQTEGDVIYSSEDNVDYKFVLDRTALSEIRKYNKEQGSYRNYGKNFSIINGVSVYSSDLIRKGLLSDIKYSPKKGTLGCNNEKSGACDNDLKIGG